MASTSYYADIQKLYVAYFNRPADVNGLQHWQGVLERTGGDLSLVSSAFAASQEYKDVYAGKNALATVAAVYQNLFGHTNDLEGMMWWAERLADGRFTVDVAVTAIAAGAQGSDLVAYNNKVKAAQAFTANLDTLAEITGYDGLEANARAKLFISGVTTDASLAAAIAPAALNEAILKVITPPSTEATFTLAATAASVDEGKTVYFNLGSTNAVAGSEYSYVISGVDAGDVVGGALTGTVKLDSTGKAIIAITLNSDATTEGIENLALTVAGKTASVIVADTSLTPATSVTYALTASATTVDEGGQVTFKLDTTGVAAGTVLSYQLTGIDASRVNGPTAGQVTVDANGQALIVVKTVANAMTDGATTMQLSLVNGAAAVNVGVNDTSLTPTVFTIDSAKIVAANNTNSPVVVTVADTGTATVNIMSTSAIRANGGIVIQGDADTTVNMGSNNSAVSNETVYVTGTGSNTVNFGRQSTDSVILGNGNDTVSVNSLTMVAGQTIDFGTGTDTLDVNGTNNFSAGTLSGVEHVTMHSSAVFSAAQMASIQTVTEAGTDGTLSIVAVGAVNTVDLTGKLVGEMKLAIGAGVAVTMTEAELANITAVTTAAGATITTTVEGAKALLAVAPSASYIISDTAEHIAAAPASVFSGVGIKGVGQQGAGSLSIEQAVAVSSASTIVKYTVEATAADLVAALVFDKPRAALVSANATVKVAGTVSAEQGAKLIAANLKAEFGVTDTAAHVLSYIVQLASDKVSSVTVTTPVTAAEATTLTAFGTTNTLTVTGLAIVDTAANLAGLSEAAEANAASIRLSTGQTISTATAEALQADFGAKFVGGYSLTDSAANIVAKPVVAAGATNIVVTDAQIGVAVATQLSQVGNAGSIKYVLTDSPANLASATPSVLANATAVTVQGNVTVAQANAIAGYAVANFTLVDSAAALLTASPAVLAKALAAGGHLVTTDLSISYATAVQLFARDAGAIYAVADTAANLVLATDLKALDQAATVTVSGTVTVAQTVELDKLVNDAATAIVISPYTIADTVSAVLAANAAALDGANKVSASGTASVAQVASLKAIAGFDGKFAIVDTAANVATLIGTGAAGIATLNASTAAVVITGPSTVAQAAALKSVTFTNWNGQYSLVDSVAALTGAAPALIDGATSVIAQDTVQNVNNSYAWINVNTDGYAIADTIVNLLADNNEIVVRGAKSGVATGVAATAAEATELFGLNANIDYNVTDSAAALALAANKNGVTNAAIVTLNTSATVAQIQAITALHSVATYNLADTAANLSNIANAAVVDAAAALSVSDAFVTAATANIVFGLNDNVTFAKIKDSAANIQEVSTAALLKTTALEVTDANRLVLNAAELTHFGHTGVNLNNVTTSAPGATSTAVRFDLVDTMEKLAGVQADLASAGKVTVLAGGAAVDVAAAAAVLAVADVVGVYNVTGTVAALLANGAATHGAASVTATGAAATAAQAKDLVALNTAAKFDVSGTVAELLATANAAGVKAAADVDVTDTATVAQFKAIMGLNAAADFVTVSDTAANLETLAAGSLKGVAVSLSSGTATLAQKVAIDAAAGAAVTMAVSDTASNIATGSATKLAGATAITMTGTATAAEAIKLKAIDTAMAGITLTINVKDTAAGIVANQAGVAGVATVVVSTPATAAEAVVLKSLALTYTVTDSAANLLNIDNAAGLVGATVTVDGDVNVATAAQLSKLGAATLHYDVVDTLANLVTAASQGVGSTAGFNLNAVLGGADSVTIVGGGSIEFANVGGVFVPTGSVADLKALPAGLLTNGYVVNDTVASIVANLGFAVASKGGAFHITDTGAHILEAATSLINSAATVTVDGAVTGDAATAILAAKTSATLAIADTMAELLSNSAAVQKATAVTATTVANAADAAALVALKPTAVFSVSDTAANLIGTTGYAKAVSVTVTGASTVADIVTIDTAAVVASYNLTDTAANLAANAAVVRGATAVIVSGVDATAAEAKAIYEAKATAVYEITDATIANLFTNGVVNAWVAAAKSVTATGAVSVAQASSLVDLGAKFEGSFSVSDTAANFAKASQATLNAATAVSVSGIATAAEAAAIKALTYGAAKTPVVGTFTIEDSAANLMQAANATLAGKDVAIDGTVTVADAASIDAKNTTGAILSIETLSDTSTNLQLGAAAIVNKAGDIHVTDTQTVAQANFLMANVASSADYSFAKITDSVSNVLGNLATAKEAAVISMTGNASIAQAVTISEDAVLMAKLTGSIGIADTANNVLNSFLDPNFKSFVTGATSLTINGTASVAQAAILEGFANVPVKSIVVEDTIANINANAAVVNLAKSAIVTVDVDLARQVFSDAGMSTTVGIKYTNGALNDAGIVTTAPGVYDTSAADILTLKSGDKIDLSAFGLHADDGDGILENGEYLLIQGSASNGGNTFTAGGSGTSTLLVWDADTDGTLVHASGVVLVGQSGTQLVIGEGSSSSLSIDLTPGPVF